MVFTIDDIRKRVIPIVIKYGINTFSLFGSYARNEANENSDLDFVMNKGDLKGLQYVSSVQELEEDQLIGLRNVIVHNYENIIDDIIWEVMHEDVPEIKEYLEMVLYN